MIMHPKYRHIPLYDDDHRIAVRGGITENIRTNFWCKLNPQQRRVGSPLFLNMTIKNQLQGAPESENVHNAQLQGA